MLSDLSFWRNFERFVLLDIYSSKNVDRNSPLAVTWTNPCKEKATVSGNVPHHFAISVVTRLSFGNCSVFLATCRSICDTVSHYTYFFLKCACVYVYRVGTSASRRSRRVHVYHFNLTLSLYRWRKIQHNF